MRIAVRIVTQGALRAAVTRLDEEARRHPIKRPAGRDGAADPSPHVEAELTPSREVSDAGRR